MAEFFIVAKFLSWVRWVWGFLSAGGALTTAAGRSGLAAAAVARIQGGATGSLGSALAVTAGLLVALGVYTWAVMHVQYGWDSTAWKEALAAKNATLGAVNAEEGARVSGKSAERAEKVRTIMIEVEKRIEVPGPERIVHVPVETPAPVITVTPAVAPHEAHRISDTPESIRAKLNAIR